MFRKIFLSFYKIAHYPNTGVVLSTASVAESHESSRYRSGIFSHQFLSALWGSSTAANQNNDGGKKPADGYPSGQDSTFEKDGTSSDLCNGAICPTGYECSEGVCIKKN